MAHEDIAHANNKRKTHDKPRGNQLAQDQLTKLASVPAWLMDMFSRIDKKDFQGARNYMADDIVIEFAHYTLNGADQFIKTVGWFDVQFMQYRHGIEQVWQGEGVVMFGGHLVFVLADGSNHTTPFWNIFITAKDNPQKVVKGSAIFDMATVPQSYWPKMTD
jgi:hypothetical protein